MNFSTILKISVIAITITNSCEESIEKELPLVMPKFVKARICHGKYLKDNLPYLECVSIKKVEHESYGRKKVSTSKFGYSLDEVRFFYGDGREVKKGERLFAELSSQRCSVLLETRTHDNEFLQSTIRPEVIVICVDDVPAFSVE